MSADAALPEDVLFAITTIDKFLNILPESDDRPSLPAPFGVFCSALIRFTRRHPFAPSIGVDYG
jgi:hypothetical protein